MIIRIHPDQYVNLDNVEGIQIVPGNYPNKYSLLFIGKSGNNTWQSEIFDSKDEAVKYMDKLGSTCIKEFPKKAAPKKVEPPKKEKKDSKKTKVNDEIPY